MSIRKRQWQSKGDTKTAWVCDYVDQHGKRRLKTFDLKKDADTWAITARHEVATGVHAANSKATIADVYGLWLNHCRDEGLERGSLAQRETHFRIHIAPFIGPVRLAELTTPGVNEFADRLRDAGMSPVMRRKVLTSLRSCLAYARARGLVAQNVASGLKIRIGERRTAGPLKAGRDFPSKAELKLLIDRAPPAWRAFMATAIFTGMRASEIRGLRWQDVDLEAGSIHVAQRADYYGAIGAPKSKAGNRDIPLTPIVVNALRQWRARG